MLGKLGTTALAAALAAGALLTGAPAEARDDRRQQYRRHRRD